MSDRIALAASKGCDGVDPDNVDGYSNRTGFPLSYNSQLDYNRFLFDTAHDHGLAVSLKNDLGQIEDLVVYADFAVNESWHWTTATALAATNAFSRTRQVNTETAPDIGGCYTALSTIRNAVLCMTP